jgi:hypothetical protein
MLGSTFIAEPNPSKLKSITSAEDLDSFTHVDLNRMTTIDFAEALAPKGLKWAEGKPVLYHEQDGVALFKITDAALAYVIAHVADFPADHRADLQKLTVFLKQNGTSHIYELATF